MTFDRVPAVAGRGLDYTQTVERRARSEILDGVVQAQSVTTKVRRSAAATAPAMDGGSAS